MGFFVTTVLQMLINLIYTILALAIGLIGLKIADEKLFRKIDFEEEISKGNMAAAVFASTILISVAIIVAFTLKG